MNVEVIPVTVKQKSVLRQLMELYSYDFSEYTEEDIDDHGYYHYAYLDHYWTEETRHPFFIRADGVLAGFVLVCSWCEYTSNREAHSISEFFILRKYRKKGIGRVAANYVFELFQGEWEVRVLNANQPARAFWEKVIDGYTGGTYVFHPDATAHWKGFGYTFTAQA